MIPGTKTAIDFAFDFFEQPDTNNGKRHNKDKIIFFMRYKIVLYQTNVNIVGYKTIENFD